MMNELGITDNAENLINSNTLVSNVNLYSVKRNQLILKLDKSGTYSINIISLNGSTLQTFDNRNYKSGLNYINMDDNKLPKGAYLFEIIGNRKKVTHRLIIN